MSKVFSRLIKDGKVINARVGMSMDALVMGNGIPSVGRTRGTAKDRRVEFYKAEENGDHYPQNPIVIDDGDHSGLPDGLYQAYVDGEEVPGLFKVDRSKGAAKDEQTQAEREAAEHVSLYSFSHPDIAANLKKKYAETGIQVDEKEVKDGLTALASQLKRLIPSVKRARGIQSASESMDSYLSGGAQRQVAKNGMDAYLADR